MMEKNKSQNISENGLDKLLNQAFLNLDFNLPVNQKIAESVCNRALIKTTPFSLPGKMVFNKIIILFTIGILTGGLILYLKMAKTNDIKPSVKFQPAQKPEHFENPVPENQSILQNKTAVRNTFIKNKITKDEIKTPSSEEKIVLSGHIKNFKDSEGLPDAAIYKQHSDISVLSAEQGYFSLQLPKGESVIVVSLLGYQTYTFSVYSDENVSRDIELKKVWNLLDEVTVTPEEYIFPNLTEKEKRANEKEKQNMTKAASRLKPGKDLKYPFIPAPADQSFSSFYMESAEVNNLEYRTFLFDLLINGKKEEFLIAKPEQDLWINAGGVHFFDTLSRVYFSDKKYNFYPVVNIPVAGAEMYCRWLGRLVNEIRQKENKPAVEVRLPYEKEWLHAASGGRSGAVYPWPLDSVQNRVNWFLANCCIQKQADKLKYPLGHGRKFDPNAYTSAGMTLANHRISTVEVFAYNPNDFYLYCMSGNASEMVYAGPKKTVKAKGGSWNSDFEHLKLTSEDEFKDGVKPSPMIGFRVCEVIKQ